jgi:hypothetical protein
LWVYLSGRNFLKKRIPEGGPGIAMYKVNQTPESSFINKDIVFAPFY